MKRKLIAVTLIAVLICVGLGNTVACTPTPTQWEGGFELLGYNLPPDNDTSWAVALGDVDGDEDLDIIFANYDQNRLYLNNGAGVFTDATSTNLPADSDNSFAVALGDVDDDGDLDIIFANRDEQNRLYLNNGAGAFTDATSINLPADIDDSEGVALGDVDGDGDLDIIFANAEYPEGQQNRLYLNSGNGTFTDHTSTNLPVDSDRSDGVALGDVDGDEDLDIIFANSSYPAGGQNRLYLNSGNGTFTNDTSNLPADSDLSTGVALGDVDGDEDPDIIFANYDQNTLYLNSGNGTFTNDTSNLPADSDDSEGVALGDVDGDDDLDIIFANNEQNSLYLNSGNGTFTNDTSNLPALSAYVCGVALGDVDGDDDLDIVLADRFNQNRLYLNDGGGVFTDATSTTLPSDSDWSCDVALGDVDGDDDLDAVFANSGFGGGQNRLYLNDGGGAFTDATSTSLPALSDCSAGVALGDVDGDGDLDIVFANGDGFEGQQNRLYLNNGAGAFTDATSTNLPADSDESFDVALGDVDGDDDLDIILANRDQNRLYLNNGAGVFADATSTNLPAGEAIGGVALGDVDGDDDLDIVFADWGQDRLYLNNGNGTFTNDTSNLPSDDDETEGVALGDVDGDGDLDIILANGWGKRNRLYLNRGEGTFRVASPSYLPLDSDYSADVALGDVDCDGDLDIIFANDTYGWSENRLYLNNGAGVFADATSTNFPALSSASEGVALGDVDGDDDLDIIFANNGQNRLYFNRQS